MIFFGQLVIFAFSLIPSVKATDEIMNGASDRDDSIPIEEEIQKILDDPRYTEEQKNAFINKLLGVPLEDIGISTRAANLLNVTAYKQEYSWSCGAATTKQTLNYHGVSLSESTIRNGIGITQSTSPTIEQLKNYINGKISRINYIISSPSSESNLRTFVNSSINNLRSPVIALINTNSQSAVFGYASSGHFVNVIGISDYGNEIRYYLADPYRPYKKLDMKYYVSPSELYTAIYNHTQKKISW